MKWLVVILVGAAAGLAGGYFARPSVDRALGGATEVEGEVVAERRQDDRLLLTLRAGDETIVASFRERADDVEELVSEGDHLTVRVGAHGVFADEVPIVRLRRAADVAAAAEGPEPETEAPEAEADTEAPTEPTEAEPEAEPAAEPEAEAEVAAAERPRRRR